MASISRIQVANFLSDGYTGGKEWVPLYRGETIRLFGQSAALQVDNGGGKTSLTEACLYLLSHDRRLKPKVEDRVAPVDRGWTHIRIEFVEKAHDEDILQADLITRTPEDIPGITYVIGMCWSRTKEPIFYFYQGLFEDAPCYIQEPRRLALVDNDSFRKSIDRIPGSRWNRWRNQTEWLDDIRQFTNIEVIKQNVEFQIEGAGDYSAMVNKVKPEGDETYDAAFFRQFIAPELLKHAMGAEGEADEQRFEDTILKTLKPTADALVDINMRHDELESTKQALQKFEPVLEKANEVVDANAAYSAELNAIAKNAAIVHALAVASPLPGMPIVPAGTQWASDKRVVEALSHMVIDKRHGVVITDEGLGVLAGVETRRLNERARELKVAVLTTDNQVIDIQADLKQFGSKNTQTADSGVESQHIEYKADLKESARGKHRKYAVNCYDFDSALLLVNAAANFTGAKTAGLADVLTRAFGIAADEIDTNPYRARLRKLSTALTAETGVFKGAKEEFEHQQKEYEVLIKESREAKENQIAFEGFAARKAEFPEEFREAPVAAREWARKAATTAQTELTEHLQFTSERQSGYDLWNDLTEKHGLAPLPDALNALNQQHTAAIKLDGDARHNLKQAGDRLRTGRANFKIENAKLANARSRFACLDTMAASLPAFREIFGDADPASLNPQTALQAANALLTKKDNALQQATSQRDALDKLFPKTRLYLEIFGEADPALLNPSRTLLDHMQSISIEDGIVTEQHPFLEALTYFRELHPGLTPEEWISQTAKQRDALNVERIGNNDKIGDLEDEISDLDTFGAADDRVYAKALKVLGDQRIAFDRLHDMASRSVTGGRLKQCLTLFSAALSAPVIDSVEVAAEAAKVLEEAELTVPIFLRPALEQFLRDGEIHQTGEVAHTLWAGRHTRQVAILLNPALIEEEKAKIQSQIDALNGRNEEIEKLLKPISEVSDAVKTAIDAKEAIRRNSEQRHKEALTRLDGLYALTNNLERRASQEALDSIAAMNRYMEAGGDAKRANLIEQVIPQLSRDKKLIGDEIKTLATQVTEEAMRALHAAKDYQREGGETAYNKAKEDVSTLEPRVSTLESLITALQEQVEGDLNDQAIQAAANLATLNETYTIDKRDLEQSIQFDQDDHVAFMKNSVARRQAMEHGVDTAQKRLQDIDFDRAERYIKLTKLEDRSISKRIADTEAKRVTAVSAMKAAEIRINEIKGNIAFVMPFVEAMHEMVVSIRAQNTKISGFSEDIRLLMRSTTGGHAEIMDYAESIRMACLGEMPSIEQEIRSAMANLKGCMDELEIDTRHLQDLDKSRKQTQRDFIQRRDEFCDRARKGEIKGLSQLEIEDIAQAKTIEQLQRINTTKDKIENQIHELESNLSKLKEAMEVNKAATINNLVSFASQASLSLKILDQVMRRTPKARFHVETPVASDEDIKSIIEFLISEIEDKERSVRERSGAMLNNEIERRASDYKKLIHDTIYKRIFIKLDEKEGLVTPKVYFTHASIRGTEKVPFLDKGLSTGQRTALMMMWLIKQAEFALTRAAMLYDSKKERMAAIKGSQRIMFFDGLFSNLSNEDYINHAFQGLRDVGNNFQLIGLIHNPYYVNNKDIFPVHLVGKRKLATKGDRQQVFVAIEPWQEDNGMILYTSAYKHNSGGDHAKS